MHPQLDHTRFASCEELLVALERCHRHDFYKRALGLCNVEKDELSKCLHASRKSAARERIIESKKKDKLMREKWREMDEELFGKDNKLKKVIEVQYKSDKE